MKFFLPMAEAVEDVDREYLAIKTHLALSFVAALSSRRVFSLVYSSHGKDHAAVVGDQDSGGEGLVIAIFYEPLRSLYYVCTPYRGVLGPGFTHQTSLTNNDLRKGL